jgi:hypothetical protein
MMCGCETRIIVDDMQQCLNLFCKRLINTLKKDIQCMRSVCAKNLAESQLAEYILVICTDASGNDLKYNSGWEAASIMGCSTVNIDKREYILFPCAPQKCNTCVNRWEGCVPKMEANSTKRISCVIFGTHQKCSSHGDEHIQTKGN